MTWIRTPLRWSGFVLGAALVVVAVGVLFLAAAYFPENAPAQDWLVLPASLLAGLTGVATASNAVPARSG